MVGERGRAQENKTENNTWKERGSWERRLKKQDDQREEGNGGTEKFFKQTDRFLCSAELGIPHVLMKRVLFKKFGPCPPPSPAAPQRAPGSPWWLSWVSPPQPLPHLSRRFLISHFPSQKLPISFLRSSGLALFPSVYSFGACLRCDTSQLSWPPGTGHTELAIVAPVRGPPGWEQRLRAAAEAG